MLCDIMLSTWFALAFSPTPLLPICWVISVLILHAAFFERPAHIFALFLSRRFPRQPPIPLRRGAASLRPRRPCRRADDGVRARALHDPSRRRFPVCCSGRLRAHACVCARTRASVCICVSLCLHSMVGFLSTLREIIHRYARGSICVPVCVWRCMWRSVSSHVLMRTPSSVFGFGFQHEHEGIDKTSDLTRPLKPLTAVFQGRLSDRRGAQRLFSRPSRPIWLFFL